MKNSEKIEIIDYIIELSRNLEEKTEKNIKQKIGWINTGMRITTLSIQLNDPYYYFFIDDIGFISSDILKANIKDITFYDDIYLDLNKLIDNVYKS